MIAVVIATAPPVTLIAISHPGPSPAQVLTTIAAGVPPGAYFGLTAPALATATCRLALLALLSKFAATATVAFALAAIGVASVYGLVIAVPALGITAIVAPGTALLSRGRITGAIPLLLSCTATGVICLRWHFSDNFDNAAIHLTGAIALGLACLASGLIIAEKRTAVTD
jgi:hypothetical protein